MIEERTIELANTDPDGEGCEEKKKRNFLGYRYSPHKRKGKSLRLLEADEICRVGFCHLANFSSSLVISHLRQDPVS